MNNNKVSVENDFSLIMCHSVVIASTSRSKKAKHWPLTKEEPGTIPLELTWNQLPCWNEIWHAIATKQTIQSNVDRDLHIMNIWRFVYRSVVWWHFMIGRHWVRCQSWPQCGYSFFWITPVSPAACRALLFCLHSWFVVKQSRLNSVVNCPSKTWTYDPRFILDGGTVVAGSNPTWSCSPSIFWPDLYILLAKRWFYLQ